MSSQTFYPYATVPEGIILELDVPDLDPPRGDDGTILLYELQGSSYAVRASFVVLQQTLDAISSAGDTPELWLLARSSEGRSREGWNFGRADTAQHLFEWDANDWRGTMDIQAVLVRGDNRAGPKGTTLAWSPIRRVHFTEPVSPPGNNLRIRWRDFQHEEGLRHLATHLYTLSQAGPDAEPEILLNQGVAGLYDILMSRGTHGAKARIRDAVFMQIVHQVWTSVLTAVLENVRYRFAEEPDLEASDVLANLPAWQAGILRSWAPALTRLKDRAEALSELIERLCGDAGGRVVADLVMTAIPDAIQERFGTRKAYDGLMKDAGMFHD